MMNEKQLAAKLAAAESVVQKSLLSDNAGLVGEALADELKKLCYEAWVLNVELTKRIISALVLTSQRSSEPAVTALAQWSLGVGEILVGQMRTAIEFFDKAERQFLENGRILHAAETQVGKLYALAMLGLYEDAVQCGLRARDIFLQKGETLAAGKIEQNLGNLYQRRDRYDRAEHFLTMARRRYEEVGDVFRLIQTENSLANAFAHQHRFDDAENLYQHALDEARLAKLQITQAEIESNLGHLLIFKGQFDGALRYFESSRRRYETMDMPHQSAIAEQEIADSYLELNLTPEAAVLYERAAAVFEKLELNAERARVLASLARTCIGAGEIHRAHLLLAESQLLFAREGNLIGAATVEFIEAKLCYGEKNYQIALEKSAAVEKVFANANLTSRALHARWLRGESLRLLDDTFSAREFLESAHRESERSSIRQITLRCLTSLGLLERDAGNVAEAEARFLEAIAIVEELRAPLPAEDFRTAFLADKLTPFTELIRLYIENAGNDDAEKAFIIAENARSRVLLEMLKGETVATESLNQTHDVKITARLEKLRLELNWLYGLLNRSLLEVDFEPEKLASIQEKIRDRENDILENSRKQGIFNRPDAFSRTSSLDVFALRGTLGEERALVEYFITDGAVSAFVVTDEGVRVCRTICEEKSVIGELRKFQFQIDAMKIVAIRNGETSYDNLSSTRQCLSVLYNLLIKPLEKLIGWRQIIVVPQGPLHYVPFHALFDGFGYLIESREVSYAPSARILVHCRNNHRISFKRALLIGVADEFAPYVDKEVETLSRKLPEADVLTGTTATLENLKQFSARADIVHFACHGRFRPDSPMFSALRLSDGWFNVRDAGSLRLNSSLVVLSACETGINTVAAGDELLGLARGFLSAGASSLVLSLWPVDDRTTSELMSLFYDRLRADSSPAGALRLAQIEILRTTPHPFFWSPFIAVGSF